MNTTIIQFLIETVNRIKEKTPDYFIKLRKFAALITIILFAVANLEYIAEWFDIILTERWVDIAAICANIYPIIATVFGLTFLPKETKPENNVDNQQQ